MTDEVQQAEETEPAPDTTQQLEASMSEPGRSQPTISNTKTTEEHRPGKTRWDKASVISQAIGAFAIPIAVGALIFQVWQFNVQQQSNSKMAMDQFLQTQQLMQDQQHQTTLDTYIDRMSDLLLIDHLAASKPGDRVRALAVARTLTAVRNLDGLRKGILIRFLWGAKLINGPQPIIGLLGANLKGAIFTNANLSGVNLSTANLNGTDLSRANLSGANLSGANLSGVNFTGANLRGADLLLTDLSGAIFSTDTILSDAYLSSTDLSINPSKYEGAAPTGAHLYPKGLAGQNLHGAPLEGAYLHAANLSGANLNNADLSWADLSEADLSGVDLSGASMYGAIVTSEQLAKAKSLKDSTLPDGSKHS